MDALYFLESEREIVFDVTGGVRIVCQLDMIVKPVFFFRDAQAEVPFHPGLLPVLIPLLLCAGADKELHFHLLEFPHPEDELPGYDLVAESLPDLGDPERDLHTAGLL